MKNRSSSRVSLASACLAGLALTGLADAGDIHVPSDHGTLAIALNNASDGDVIILAPGNHFANVDLGAFLGSANVTITSSGGPDVTSLDGGGIDSVIRITGGQSLATVIEGLTITNGDAARGGGIYIQNSSATVRDCKIVNNDVTPVTGDGGAIFIETGTLEVEDTVFLNNQAWDVGGAVYCRTATTASFERCHFEGNVAPRGGALAANGTNTKLVDCTFLMNGTQAATEDGGAIWSTNSHVDAYRCLFEANEVFDDGSAILAENFSIIDIENSVFVNNVAVSNATVYSWQAGTSIDVWHCTMIGNEAAGSSCLRTFEGGVATFRNGIMWDNVGGSVNTGSVTVSYSTVQGGFAGTGNISVNPLLDVDLSLHPGSPAIDAADSYVLLGDDPSDYLLNPRAQDDPDTADTGVPVYGRTADMGAFEFQPAGGGVDPCPVDTNGDGLINITDLLNLLAAWGSCF